MDNDSFISKLKDCAGPENVFDGKADIAAYSSQPFSSGFHDLPPLAVAAPANYAHVRQIISLCASAGVQIRIRGGGTAPFCPKPPQSGRWIILQTTRLDRILEIDAENRLATVQCGLSLRDFANAVASAGLYFPLAPWFEAAATIGGFAASREAGPINAKYGLPGRLARELRVYGSQAREFRLYGEIPQKILNGGVALAPLFCGSDGNFGLITQLTLQLFLPPVQKLAALAEFPLELDAAQAAAEIAACTAPACLEFLDQASATQVEAAENSVLIIGFEGAEAGKALEAAKKASLAHGGSFRLPDSDVAKNIWEKRSRLPVAFGSARIPYARATLDFLPSRFPGALESLREFSEKSKTRLVVFGSAAAASLTVLIMNGDRDDESVRRLRREIFGLELVLNNSLMPDDKFLPDRAQWLARRWQENVPVRLIRQMFDPAALFSGGEDS